MEKALLLRASDLNCQSPLLLERVFSVVRRLEEHLQGVDLSEAQIDHLVDELFYYNIGIPIPMPLSEKIQFTRAIRYGEKRDFGYDRVSRLSYIPPAGTVPKKLGRMNAVGESVFYACVGQGANSDAAALSEVRARPGEIFNILCSETYAKEPADGTPGSHLNVMPIGLFDHYRRGLSDPYGLGEGFQECYEFLGKKTNIHGMLAMQLVDAFMSDILRRAGSDRLYGVTSLLPAQFSTVGMVDGVIFPSTQFEGVPNVALRTYSVDRKIVHTSVRSVRVLEKYGYGLFKSELLAQGKISGDQIEWVALNRFRPVAPS